MNWIINHRAWLEALAAALLAAEQALPETNRIKANSITQLVVGLVKTLLPKSGSAFVDVDFDKGFGECRPAPGGSPHVLNITDIPPELAKKALTGKAFDWHTIPATWRHNLEIGGFHAAPWDEVKMYLREG